MSAQHPLPNSVLVCGAARNCARTIVRDLERLRDATDWIAKVQFLVVESDSDDGTLATLQQLASTWSTLQLVTLGRLRETTPGRTERIAMARNRCLDALDGDARFADVDHLIVADLDGMCRDLQADALKSCWSLSVPWSVCSANQGDYYYDIWALRHPHWCPGDAGQDQEALVPALGKSAAKQLSVFSRMVHIARDAAPIEVDSAFGGLAVYKRASIKGLRYVGLDDQGRPVCEHVALNLALRRRGGRIFIHPRLINARRTEHSGRRGFWRTLRRQLWHGLQGHGWGG